MRPLSEQVVVITGASSGIGRCTARHLGAKGARLVLFARDPDALEVVADEVRGRGGDAVVVAGDVSRADDIERLATVAVGSFGRIDTWVNNAAVFIQGLAEEIEPEEYRRVLEVDLLGPILGTRRAIRQMKDQGEGVIVQVSSIVAQRGAAYFSAYAAAKRGLVGFTQSARAELCGTDIKISLLYLPTVDTPIYEHARGKFGTMPRPAPPLWTALEAARAVADLAESGALSRHVGWFHWIYTAPGLVSDRFGDWFLNRTAGLTLTEIPAGPDNLDGPSGPWSVSGGWRSDRGVRGLRVREIARLFPGVTALVAAGLGLLLVRAVLRK